MKGRYIKARANQEQLKGDDLLFQPEHTKLKIARRATRPNYEND